MPASAISRCSRVAGCPSGRCHACCQDKDACATTPTSWDADTPEWEKQGPASSSGGSWDASAHLPEGHSEGAGLAGDRLLGGMVLQDDAIALQYHQWLPVQGQGARLGLLGHCEAQLSSIGGHLGHRVNRRSAAAPTVGPATAPASHCSHHLFHSSPQDTATLLLPSLCLCCSCCLEFPFFSRPLPTLSPRKQEGRFQKWGPDRRLWKEEKTSSPGEGDEMPMLVTWVPAALTRLN